MRRRFHSATATQGPCIRKTLRNGVHRGKLQTVDCHVDREDTSLLDVPQMHVGSEQRAFNDPLSSVCGTRNTVNSQPSGRHFWALRRMSGNCPFVDAGPATRSSTAVVAQTYYFMQNRHRVSSSGSCDSWLYAPAAHLPATLCSTYLPDVST